MRRARGFTLLEMLVAASLFAMMMVAVVAAMRTLGNTRATLETVTLRVGEVRAVSEFLRRSIGGALPVIRVGDFSGGEAGTAYGTYFLGSPREMTWVAPLVAGANVGGAYVMRLAREEDRLLLRWHPYQRDVAGIDWSAQQPRVLVDAVDEFTLGYRGGFEGDWMDEWRGDQRLPVAVRLQIRAQERHWPELVIGLSGASMNLR